MYTDFLMTEFLGNKLQDYLWLLAAIMIGLLFKKLISRYFSRLLFKIVGKKDSSVGVDRFDELLTKPIGLCVMLSIIFLGASHIQYPSEWGLVSEDELGLKMFISKGFALLYVFSVFWILLKLIDYVGLILHKRAEETESKMDDQLIPFIIEIAKILTYLFAIFIIMGNVFDVNVTALATGLGIGGIAIAMASKESLENLLGSFTIFFDRPFTVGDVVTAGNVTGVVEKVGFRSTRIRTFDKSIVTVPNKNMISTELDNLGERPVRRAKFNIGLTYDASIEQIKKVVKDIQEMIDKHPKTNQDGRVRFKEFGGSSLDIMVMYFVDSPNWDDFIDTKQDINYQIMDIVQKNKCDFAFPSSTVYLQKNN
ncbi:MAG: mechanosensitive ion channel protein MscS [Flavobacteriales bacterium]|nr:mechanosensitive ion channel protein MscS [Flavobacteriales bacterium]|tara:strand:+ start:40294 stop:41394 length:1101 start_codon:yes stop_codon:yes gene_type:complete